MQLETERLILREFVREDAAEIHRYASSPEVTRYMVWGPNTREQTDEYVDWVLEAQARMPRVSYELAAVLKENDQLIGGCGLHVAGYGQGELGYCLNRPYWGKGFATEAASALMRYGFGALDLHRLYATCRPDNRRSAKVMQRLGMSYEGHIREHLWHRGRWHDSYQYSILRQEYEGKFLNDGRP